MKLIIMFLLFSYTANATNYHVKKTGSDAADGSISTPWLTVSKVNSSSYLPGDSILFYYTDVFNDKLIPPSSGTIGNPIVVATYGGSSKSTITGFKTLTGLVNIGGNIWSAVANDAVKYLNTVKVDGQIMKKGRYPNTGWLPLSLSPLYSKDTVVAGTGFTGTPDYTGGEFVIRTNSFVTDVAKIKSQNVDTLRFNHYRLNEPAISYGGGGYFFFIQNHLSVLDQQGEWAHDSLTNTIYVYSELLPVVEYSNIDTLIHIHKKDYVTLYNLNITGADKSAIYIDSCIRDTVKYCTINNSGIVGITLRSSYFPAIIYDSIMNSMSGAIYANGLTFDSANYGYNYIKNTGIWSGMGLSGNSKYMAITSWGGRWIHTHHNRIDSVGFNAIYWTGNNQTIEYNYITNFNLIKDDGAAIYTFSGSLPYQDTGSIIQYNILIKGGIFHEQSYSKSAGSGIYFDLDTKGVTARFNTISNTWHSGINFFYSNNINIYDNTIVDSVGIPLRFYVVSGGFNVKRNILYSYSNNVNVPCFYTASNISSSSIDSNYYLISNNAATRLNKVVSYYNLASWQAATGWDANSSEDQSLQTSRLGTLYINPTTSDSTVTFSGWKVDAKGEYYNSSAVITPFQSKLLFASDEPIDTVVVPIPVVNPPSKIWNKGFKIIQATQSTYEVDSNFIKLRQKYLVDSVGFMKNGLPISMNTKFTDSVLYRSKGFELTMNTKRKTR